MFSCIKRPANVSTTLFYFPESGASLAGEFLSDGMCRGGIDDNCTTVTPQEGSVHHNTKNEHLVKYFNR